MATPCESASRPASVVPVSDADLRELERKFRETGSVEDEAAWLRARVQAGELSQENLELAAFLGHEGAQFAADSEIVAPSVEGDGYDTDTCLYPSLSEWTRQLCVFGLEAAVRAGIASSVASLPTFETAYPGVTEPRTALNLTEEWVLDQTSERAKAAVAAGLNSEEPVCMVNASYGPAPDQQTVGFGPAYGALTLADEETLEGHGSEQLSDFTSAAVVSVSSAAHVLPPEEVVRVVAQELIPFALGYLDPIRERVDARQRAEVAGE